MVNPFAVLPSLEKFDLSGKAVPAAHQGGTEGPRKDAKKGRQ
jgi:hypothetical protein